MKRVFAWAARVVGAIVIAACGTTTACAPTPERLPPGHCNRVYIVSSQFSTEERAAIERANERWNQLGIERFCLTTGENTDNGIRRVPYGSPEWQARSLEIGKWLLGQYRSGPDQITLYLGTASLEEVELIAIHELGHARGLKHVPEVYAIMHSSIGDSTSRDFTSPDRRECKRVEACSSDVQVVGTGNDEGPDACDIGPRVVAQ